MRRGFTLIEALTVIAIIGTLAALTTYVITSAQRQARDAKRRSDLTAIGVGFQARFEAETCDASARNRYPGYTSDENNDEWQNVTNVLTSYSDACGAFTEFLSSIPRDPKFDGSQPYQFNLSAGVGQTVDGKHFRLRARLEKELTQAQIEELTRLSRTWTSSAFYGASYTRNNPNFQEYSYFIGD